MLPADLRPRDYDCETMLRMGTAQIVLSTLGFLFFLVLLILACLPSAAVRKLAKRLSAPRGPRK